jgi:D-alanyl-D-alanine carboxypeptidase
MKDRIREKIEKKLRQTVARDRYLKNALLLIHSDRLDIHWTFAAGTTGSGRESVSPENPYHIASIGKTFTSMLLARLYEEGRVRPDDPISRRLPQKLLEGLFVYRGVDYSGEVLVGHLLNHTSGIGDYFEDKPLKGKPIKELIIADPDRFWKPDESIAFTRDFQRAVSKPGQRFHYSDTGYNLLGKIIEQVTGKPLHENLREMIFEPLGMTGSYLMFYGQPAEKSPYRLADTFIGNHEVSTFKSISLDWAGGGIVSTTEDLLRFHRALVEHRLIRPETFELWSRDRGRFSFGMEYGYGLLFLNIHRMTLLLSKKLNMWGNFGSIAAFMFYNPFHDVYIIGSFNHSRFVVKQVSFLIDVIRKVSKLH